MIDDNVWNTNANLQTSIDNDQMLQAAASRNTTAIGTDMRTISRPHRKKYWRSAG